MRVIIAVETLSSGGAEQFALNLAESLCQKGYPVMLYIMHDIKKKDKISIENTKFPVRIFHPFYVWIIQKIDSLFFKLRIDVSLQRLLLFRDIKKTVCDFKPDVVHTNLFKTDYNFAIALERVPFNVKHVATIHGDYINFYERVFKQKTAVYKFLNYTQKLNKVLNSVHKIVCISDKQVDFFKYWLKEEKHKWIKKIYNGYLPSSVSAVNKANYHIPESGFVFGMVSRGIASKGWETAILAFNYLLEESEDKNIYLILVGAGEHLNYLQEKYKESPNIIFTGFSNVPGKWLQIFDVGLLPTYYPSESLPTVLIEYLYYGIPVIASDKGEIQNMLTYEEKKGGIVLNRDQEGKVDPLELKNEMMRLRKDKELYEQLSANTEKCFQKFDMEDCIKRYINEAYLG